MTNKHLVTGALWGIGFLFVISSTVHILYDGNEKDN